MGKILLYDPENLSRVEGGFVNRYETDNEIRSSISIEPDTEVTRIRDVDEFQRELNRDWDYSRVVVVTRDGAETSQLRRMLKKGRKRARVEELKD